MSERPSDIHMPKTTYQSIQKQIEKLQREAEALRQKEVSDVIARIRMAIEHYDITPQELFEGRLGRRRTAATVPKKAPGTAAKAPAAPRRPVAPKYRDEQGNTWAGRGNRPRWLVEALEAGRKLEDFAV